MRLSIEQEVELATAIRRAEDATRAALAGIDQAERILRRRPSRHERTRAGAVDRMEEALQVARALAAEEPALRAEVNEAEKYWRDAE